MRVDGWHTFNVKIMAQCVDKEPTISGPFDIITNNTKKLPNLEASTITLPIIDYTTMNYDQVIDTLAKMNSELLSTINKLIDLL